MENSYEKSQNKQVSEENLKIKGKTNCNNNKKELDNVVGTKIVTELTVSFVAE